jgi:putative tricarboxylic transport membrane protein
VRQWEDASVKRGWIAASSIFFVLFAGTGYLASKLALLDTLGPGPGFFPLILALLGAALALLLIHRTVREPAAVAIEGADVAPLVPDRAAMVRMIGMVVLLAASFLALDPIGYRITALVFLTLVLFVLGVRNMVAIAAVALVGSFGVFHSFYYWLKVPLPIGMFGI